MSDLAFRKRFRSSYDSSPSPTLPVRKRYRGTSKLILGTDSDEVEESSDFDSESEGARDEGPIAEDEDPAMGDKGLAVRVEGLGVDDESYGLDDKSHGVDDKSYGLDDESHGVDDESRRLADEGLGVEIDGLVLGYGALRRRDLALEGDHVYSTFETSGSLPISQSPFVVPSPISSPMIPLTVPSFIASPMATSTATIPVDKDRFIKVGAQLELYWSILQDHTQRLDMMPPILFTVIDRDV
nr:hypothetical protein [Tanacetum cinerariifolium]